MTFKKESGVSKWWPATAILVVALLGLAVIFVNSKMYTDIKTMMSTKVPKYELGEHRGAAFCGTCHSKIYKQWLAHSRHADATTNQNFLDTRNDLENNFFLRTMVGEESCYGCHGLKVSKEGVNCEICHGPSIPGLSITELHEKQYKPGLSKIKAQDFCAKCHELFPPMMSAYTQWQASKAAEEGITCQGCHMAPVNGEAYHGFDSIMHNPNMYKGYLLIRDVSLTFPNISMVVENRIKGHGIPSGGPSRVLVLEISLLDKQDKELHKIVDTFYRKFELTPEAMGGTSSAVVIEDTTLKSLEARTMRYELPAKVEGKIRKASIMFRFYDVQDKYQGNIRKSHWISEPLVKAELEIK